MRIHIKVKDIEIEVNDYDNNPVVRHKPYNEELCKTLEVMTNQAIKILNERKNLIP